MYALEEAEEQNEECFFYVVDSIGGDKNAIFTDLNLENSKVKVKVDTGAKCNVMPLTTLQKINPKVRINTKKKVNLVAYGGDTFSSEGEAVLECTTDAAIHLLTFHVVSKQEKTILGLPDTLALGLVSLSDDIEVHNIETPTITQKELAKHPKLVDDKLGRIPVMYKMKTDPTVTPVIRPPRKIPYAMRNEVEKELKRMVKIGVITPTTEPAPWVSSMVATRKKNGKDIRICIDPRDLNTALQRPRYPMKTIEQVTASMAGAKVFTILDAKNGFWQIPLDEESQLLTCFNTPFGRFKFKRMPYGLNSGSEVFQQAMEQVFSNTPCEIIVDDILVWGETVDQHDERLEKVLKRAEEINLKLNPGKCKIRVDKVTYIGHLLSAEGIKPDPEKVRALVDYPAPKNKQELQRFLGMINYVSKFVQNFSENTAAIRENLKKENEWSWTEQHEEEFNGLKQAISNPPVLKYYDSSKPVTLTCDASKSGLGAACLQNGYPIAYASRAMTRTEQNYAQIEKELLAVVFACRKFDDYVYGKKITVETDHKPLVTILNKPLHSAPTRLQKMIMILYRYDIKLVYKKGQELHIADALSRAYLPETEEENADENFEVMSVMPVSQNRLQHILEEAKNDQECRELTDAIMNGWPNNSQDVSTQIRQYYAFRDEMTIEEGVIMKGHRIVIPRSLRAEYLEELHKGHCGAETTKRRARDTMYWHGINNDIDMYTAKCVKCNNLKPHQQKEPLLMQDIPVLPWSIVATDIFDLEDEHYLVLVDSYSGWFEINKLENMTSATVINKLKRHFSVHGIPSMLMSDNGPCFKSAMFKQFAKTWDFKHATSSPHYHQSNGLAERAVRSAKHLLMKTGSDFFLDLLNLRNMPAAGDLGSPAQRLMSRRTKTRIPSTKYMLQPRIEEQVPQKLENIRLQKKRYHDKSAKSLKPLAERQVVRMQNDRGYEQRAIVLRPAMRPRSLLVQTEDGKQYERNRRHLLPVKEAYREHSETYVPIEKDLAENKPKETKREHQGEVTIEKPLQENQAKTTQVITRYRRAVKPNPKFKDYV